MSGYRSSYVPWNKNSASYSSSSSSSAKKESPSIGGQSSSASTTTSKYESPYAKSSRTDAKKSEDKSPATSTKYSTYGSYQREPSSSSRAELTSRIRSPVEKKESHPPVTYRPLIRGSTVERSRSRDPSPDKTESPYNFNRLYPRPSSYTTRSVSRERTDSTSSSTTTIPKYTGRTSLTKEDYKYPTSRNSSREDLSLAKYKPPETKEDLLTARFGKPKEDYGKFKLKEDLLRYKPKEEAASRYKTKEETASRFKPKAATSREDLTKTTTTTPTQKYITSRFLPKNTIEKSHTAYIRPSTTRTREVSLKNRELLNVLSAQQDDRTSRPVSRASSIAPEDFPKIEPKKKTPDEVQDYETVTVISRSTSPNPPSAQTSYLRSRRVEMARLMEKQIKRPVKRKETSDKEVQSDRLDDSTKSSRFAGASRITPTPWASYLDLKYSPGDAKPKESESSQSEGSDKKSISRNSSAKSLSRSSSKSDLRTKELKSRSNSSHSLKSKASPPKKLPPQIPKPESKIPTNKDFRKSVLNMNPEGKLKKLTKRSNSCSSAESESSICGGNSEATEVSENLSSCISYHPQKLQRSIEVEQRDRRSPSCTSESSSSSSSSVEDEVAVKKPVSRTSTGDDSLKPPLSPRVKSESEAKSFLRRALAPVTNFFKTKQDSSDSTDKNISDLPKSSSEEPPTRRLISKIESGERAWWLEETDDNISSKGSKQRMKLLRHQESGERAWWLEDSAEVPEGVEVFPAKSMGEDGRTEDGKLIYKIRKNDSCERDWWLDESEKTEPTPPQQQQQQQQPPQEPEFLQKYKIRHIDSGERAWWLSSTENLAVGKEEENQSKKQQESNDWWLQNDDDYDPGIPLGDRASPEGLETPRDEPDEGRLSPYDNVPSIKRKQSLFISRHTNIDDILGGGSSQLLSPLMDRIFSYQVDDCEVIDANQVKIHDSTPQRGIIQPTRLDAIGGCYKKLDDAALQLYKDGDYGSYLDLDASISEQQEEFDGFHT
ncbi:PREDICTED: serine-rich adhesin for platelets-like, partial [Nicrophorus vespilloides]|uniref:Serine-rich adhesin for platelets-like n=1 Tax=Nicrophorus vespilloides TaxID=110193 RepID=A0ABM1NI78_NICVS